MQSGATAVVDFECQLKEWCETAAGPYRRPFSPNPAWRRAHVFVIGTNPATPLRNEFASLDDYWNALTVDPAKFEAHYSARHSGSASKSTRWARKLIALLQPLNCLVTNACWYPVEKQKNIPASERTFAESGLKKLIAFVRPRAVFCHGSAAERFARSLGVQANRYLPPEEQKTVIDGMLVLAYHHFSGQGLRKGTRFDPASELPRFASRIKGHAGVL